MTGFKHMIENILFNRDVRRIAKNFSFLTFGHILTLIMNFFGFIFIARFLGPENYGIYAAVGSFVGLFSFLILRGLNTVVLREGASDINKMKLFYEKTIGIKYLFTALAIIFCIVISIFMPYSNREKFYIIIFSLSLVYSSFHNYFGIIFQALEKMHYNAAIELFNRFIFIPSAVIMLFLGGGLTGLFILTLSTEFITLITNFALSRRFIKFKLRNRLVLEGKILKSTFIFSLIEFNNFLASKIDIVMISLLSVSRDVGYYGVAYQLVIAGIAIRSLISVASFPFFVKLYNKKRVRWRTFVNYSLIMGMIVIILCIIGSFLSIEVIPLLFGESYAKSGEILSILIFYMGITFITLPFVSSLKATHNEKVMLKISWIHPILNIGMNLLFFNYFGLIGIAYSTLIGAIILMPIIIYTCKITLKHSNKIII